MVKISVFNLFNNINKSSQWYIDNLICLLFIIIHIIKKYTPDESEAYGRFQDL